MHHCFKIEVWGLLTTSADPEKLISGGAADIVLNSYHQLTRVTFECYFQSLIKILICVTIATLVREMPQRIIYYLQICVKAVSRAVTDFGGVNIKTSCV